MIKQDENGYIISVQSSRDINKITSKAQLGRIAKKFEHENLDTLIVNGRVKRLETQDDFDHKLYYNYKDNELKVKVKDFKESFTLIKPFLYKNKNLKKYDIKVQLEGEEE